MTSTPPALVQTPGQTPAPPLWLLAELTYTCPLHCVFCSNPIDYTQYGRELATDEWLEVLRQARALGAVQLGFSGGEPLTRADLEVLVAEAHRLGYYSNLITSGVGLTAERIDRLKGSGLDHIQLSFQDSTRELNDFLSHSRTFDLKRRTADLIRTAGFPMVLNCVIHRLNIDHVERIIELAVEIGAEYLELANAQYYGWALTNRDHLIPTRDQVRRAEAVVAQARQRFGGRIRILLVVPDYLETRPKRCMNGWGSVFLTIAPDGTALPCQSARVLPGLNFPNVRETTVSDIWYRSTAFNRYRGTAWMKEPCASCPEKQQDLGGCRCQAYLLTGDPDAADPVCDKSPDHALVTTAVNTPGPDVRPLVFRSPAESRRLLAKSAGPDLT